jgi:hypothetical protein
VSLPHPTPPATETTGLSDTLSYASERYDKLQRLDHAMATGSCTEPAKSQMERKLRDGSIVRRNVPFRNTGGARQSNG